MMKRCPSAVCRSLFGPIDNLVNLQELRGMRARLDERNIKRWNFDFHLGRPLAPDGPSKAYEWTKVDNIENERTPEKEIHQKNAPSFRTPVKQSENVMITPSKHLFNTPTASNIHKPTALTVEKFATSTNFNFCWVGPSTPTSTHRRHTIAVTSPPGGYTTPEKSQSLFRLSTPRTERKMLPIQESRVLALAAALEAASPKGQPGKSEPRRMSLEKKRKRNSSSMLIGL